MPLTDLFRHARTMRPTRGQVRAFYVKRETDPQLLDRSIESMERVILRFLSLGGR